MLFRFGSGQKNQNVLVITFNFYASLLNKLLLTVQMYYNALSEFNEANKA